MLVSTMTTTQKHSEEALMRTNKGPLLTLQITPSQSKMKTSTWSKSSDWGSESFKTFAIDNLVAVDEKGRTNERGSC